jgi:hypothetical protein
LFSNENTKECYIFGESETRVLILRGKDFHLKAAGFGGSVRAKKDLRRFAVRFDISLEKLQQTSAAASKY